MASDDHVETNTILIRAGGHKGLTWLTLAFGLLLGIMLYLPVGDQNRWRVILDRLGLGDEFDAMQYSTSMYFEYVFQDQPTSPADNPGDRITTISRCILNARDLRGRPAVNDSWELMVVARARSRMYAGMTNFDPADAVLCSGCVERVITFYRDGSCTAIYRDGAYLDDYRDFGVGLTAFEGAHPDEPAGRVVLIFRP